MQPHERVYVGTVVAVLLCTLILAGTNHNILGAIGFLVAFLYIPTERRRPPGMAGLADYPPLSITVQVLLVGTSVYAHAAGIYQFPTGAYLVPYLAIPILYVVGLIAVLLLRRTPKAEPQSTTPNPNESAPSEKANPADP